MTTLTGLTVAQVEHLLDRLANKTTDELVELLDCKQYRELETEWLALHGDDMAFDFRDSGNGEWAALGAKWSGRCNAWIGEQVERLFQEGKVGVPDSWLPDEEEVVAA